MKQNVLRCLTILFLMIFTFSSFNAFTDNKIHQRSPRCKWSHKVFKKKELNNKNAVFKCGLSSCKLGMNMADIAASLNSIFTASGFSSDPSTLLNPKIQGLVDQNHRDILYSINSILQILKKRGLPPNVIKDLHLIAVNYIDGLIAYCDAVNMNSKEGAAIDENAITENLSILASSAGTFLSIYIGRREIIKSFDKGTLLMEQLVRALAGVLAEPNPWGATLGNLDSQSVAAVKIERELVALIKEITLELSSLCSLSKRGKQKNSGSKNLVGTSAQSGNPQPSDLKTYLKIYAQYPDNIETSWEYYFRSRNGSCIDLADIGYKSPPDDPDATRVTNIHKESKVCDNDYKCFISLPIPSASSVYSTWVYDGAPTLIGVHIGNTFSSGYDTIIYLQPMLDENGLPDPTKVKVLGVEFK